VLSLYSAVVVSMPIAAGPNAREREQGNRTKLKLHLNCKPPLSFETPRAAEKRESKEHTRSLIYTALGRKGCEQENTRLEQTTF
jgi:hypothetical protein